MNRPTFLALVTASVLLGSTVVPLAVPVPAYAAATQLTPPTNVQLNPDGTVLWMPVNNNNGYTIYLYDASNNTLLKTLTSTLNSSSYSLTSLLSLRTTYYVKIVTRGNGVTTSDSTASSPSNQLSISTQVTLSPPNPPTLLPNGVVQWSNVLNNGYQLNVYHYPSNTLVGSRVLPKDTTAFDVTSLIPGTAQYYVKVMSLGDGSQMMNSTESGSSVPLTLSMVQLSTPATPSLSDDRVASWSHVPNNNGYRITVYNADNDQIVGFAQAPKDSQTFDLSKVILSDGTYYIRVSALGNGSNTSPDSAPSTRQIYYLAGDVYFVKPEKLFSTVSTMGNVPTTTYDMTGSDIVNDLSRKPTAYNLLVKLQSNQGLLHLNLPGTVVDKVASRAIALSTLRLQTPLGNVNLPLSEVVNLAKKSNLSLTELTAQVEIGQSTLSNAGGLNMTPVTFNVRLLDKSNQEVAKLTDSTGYIGLTAPFTTDPYVDLRTLAGVRVTDSNTYSPIPATFTSNIDKSTSVTFQFRGTGTFGVMKKELHFPDVLATHYAKNSIEALASKMVINGFEDGTFRPNETVTRAQFATMLVKTLGLPDKTQTGEPRTFTDVNQDSWYNSYVESAYRSNLISGVGDSRFAPEDKITAQDMAVMVARALKFADPNVSSLSDTQQTAALSKIERRYELASYASPAVALCVNKNILSTMTVNSFSPTVPADRAMAADMLYQLLKTLNFTN
ncbi:S-layer homology domain-containing protein [Tumebacillus sp. ITR2]|uniref:S-layer homology domain-containing protein n=1 Tax=Tumebacillus amylolyticus TaxID=2801339 RepID=A0ABS1JD84_9BACL|nr:S-layer homology domain-containing protein [Tumebacillus amylolyticus]MBL0388199.1 S-layer homology domain-containing protein [Tumebacillus amylolyticus]